MVAVPHPNETVNERFLERSFICCIRLPVLLQISSNSPTSTYLPFELELIDFEKVMHPGTAVAKSYSSLVNLIENNIPRKVLISMNEPLRHKGYTFYQASFIENGPKQTTVLATVKNHGRLFPYISSLTISLGILVHMIRKFPTLFRRKREK